MFCLKDLLYSGLFQFFQKLRECLFRIQIAAHQPIVIAIAHGRSGDKGDTSNVCVYARKPEYYKIIEREVTPEKLKAYFGDMVKGEITRYDVPSLNGFNFVMKHALGGGATMSLRLDSLGKSMGSAVMRMKIHVEDGEL